MSLYVDSSAILKRYLDEPDSGRIVELLDAEPDWVMARHVYIEVRRALARDLSGRRLTETRSHFMVDWEASHIVELDPVTCELAADLAETTGARSLDALHLAAAQRVGGGALPFLTADLRQAQVARALGWIVLGT